MSPWNKAAGVLLLSSFCGCAIRPKDADVNAEELRLREAEVARYVEQAHANRVTTTQRVSAALAAADAATGDLADTARAIDIAIGIVSNNIANADTIAFKSARTVFESSKGSYTQLNLEQGALESTNRPLDVGIQGSGFFRVRVEDPGGNHIAYTRNGNFFVRADGNLVLGMGKQYVLDPPISIPAKTTEITINVDGSITALRPEISARMSIGQLPLVTFVNAEGLRVLRDGLYDETEASGRAVETRAGGSDAGLTLQGFLEKSNVDLNRERLRLQFLSEWKQAIMRAAE